MIRAIIVDDEAPARGRLQNLSQQVAELEIVGEAKDGVECLEMAENIDFDLALLDIEMPELDGLSVAFQLTTQHDCSIIFTTSYNQYAVKAFELNAVDYLLKPFSLERFTDAVEKAYQRLSKKKDQRIQSLLQTNQLLAKKHYGQRILVKDKKSLRVIDIEDLQWVESDGNNVKLCTSGGVFFHRTPLANMEKRLIESGFARCHRSHLIKLSEVEKLSPLFKGDYMIFLKDGAKFRLSRRYAQNFIAQLEAP